MLAHWQINTSNNILLSWIGGLLLAVLLMWQRKCLFHSYKPNSLSLPFSLNFSFLKTWNIVTQRAAFTARYFKIHVQRHIRSHTKEFSFKRGFQIYVTFWLDLWIHSQSAFQEKESTHIWLSAVRSKLSLYSDTCENEMGIKKKVGEMVKRFEWVHIYKRHSPTDLGSKGKTFRISCSFSVQKQQNISLFVSLTKVIKQTWKHKQK